MKKKKYIKPYQNIVQINSHSMIASSIYSANADGDNIYIDNNKSDEEAGSKTRYGNLWN